MVDDNCYHQKDKSTDIWLHIISQFQLNKCNHVSFLGKSICVALDPDSLCEVLIAGNFICIPANLHNLTITVSHALHHIIMCSALAENWMCLILMVMEYSCLEKNNSSW